MDSLDAAIKKAGVQDTQATQMLNQLGTLQQLLSTIEARQIELENIKALNEESKRASATAESSAKTVLEDTKRELERRYKKKSASCKRSM